VKIMCDILRVSRSGYYGWIGRPISNRTIRRQELTEKIRDAFEVSRRNYGSPRIYRELKGEVSICENTVAKYMRMANLHAQTKRRFKVQTTDSNHGYQVADNLLNQDFWRPLPNQAWCADITYIPTQEGWLYLAAVIDLCSRRIVGWAMSDHMRAQLCIDALNMALQQQQPPPGLLHHSDRGVQYACTAYRSALEENDVICSMSRRGNCYDNAPMESFFSTLKRELVYHQDYQTRDEARRSIFEYIEVFYNRKRRHSALGYVCPVEFEAAII
jgi:putative transposase